MKDNIIKKIDNNASTITELDLDEWVVKELTDYFSSKISYLSNKSYGTSDSIAQSAFKELAKDKIKSSASTFLFKSKLWNNNRSIGPYVAKTLNNLCSELSATNDVKKINHHICPGCKYAHSRTKLEKENNSFRCRVCTNNLENSSKEDKNYNIYSCFSLHSADGKKCKKCSRFIPTVSNGINNINCPFCSELLAEDAAIKYHPVSAYPAVAYSLDQTLGDDSTSTFKDLVTGEEISADDLMDLMQRKNKEYDMIISAIDGHISKIKRINRDSTIVQKLLMLEAYKYFTEKHPVEMISYLVYKKKTFSFPIQARIFQEYCELIENYLPFTFTKGSGEEQTSHHIVSLTHPDLLLFEGASSFESVVDNNWNIQNNTKEIYVGGRGYKDYGPCFIGRLINVTDESGNSLLDDVEYYSFSNIKMKRGTKYKKVIVTHFRIPSHYEIDSLVILQSTRKDIVKSIEIMMKDKQ